jgi:glycosyltransferase involved in cell wall biosynthesis
MRLAWFSPWPPDRSGIAGRSADAVARLAARGHAIDVFVDARRVATTHRGPGEAPHPGDVRVLSAHDFVWREARGQYDLPVYQVGNSRLHEFIWPYLTRWPGLAVLHDGRVHHARGRALLLRRRADDYRAELTWNDPDAGAAIAEMGIAGFGGTHSYQWPLTKAVTATSRLVACHASGAVDEVRGSCPEARVEPLALGMGRAAVPGQDERRAIRRALGLPVDAVLFGAFGALGPEKRVPQILRAFAATRARLTPAHLVLGGAVSDAIDLDAETRRLDLGGVLHRLEDLDDRAFEDAIAAVDISLNLRWPSALETSGPWLQALSAARPTVIVDLAQSGRVPTLDPRTWQPHFPARPERGVAPVAVALDVLDEEHSLRKAIVRLGWDANLRAELGAAARAYWEAHHTVDRMVDGYETLIAAAIDAPAPAVALPAHLRPDPFDFTRRLLASVETPLPGILDTR